MTDTQEILRRLHPGKPDRQMARDPLRPQYSPQYRGALSALGARNSVFRNGQVLITIQVRDFTAR